MTKRITSRTAKTLLYAGRVQLVQSVLFGVQAFWAQIFILPAKVIKVVEGICRSYVWSGTNEITKKALMAWDKVCLPRAGGGLNIINLKLWNKAAIAKTSWDLAHKQDKLWIRWIHAYYVKNQLLKTLKVPQQACWMVRKVIESYSIFEEVQFSQNQKKSMIRQIYLHLLGNYRRMEWKTLVFQNAARPKAKFIMWLMIQERWLGKQKLGNGNWQQFLQWSINEAKGKTAYAMIFRMMYAEAVYHIWLERNRRVFEKKNTNEEQIPKDIAYIVSARVTPRNKHFVYSLCF
ncbi:PREDICTED: uncharacterized protein LOC109205989 [Nicotiana attenuata]|uniref:uncharacterized protein LOC109205989 n=1 Tax=Nicotiana attenuata TaxID=49451 RepID=UPI0009058251|nr:PREDICTED: uncharacterized protein LOC109205989 [Nicotiana attenuata]